MTGYGGSRRSLDFGRELCREGENLGSHHMLEEPCIQQRQGWGSKITQQAYPCITRLPSSFSLHFHFFFFSPLSSICPAASYMGRHALITRDGITADDSHISHYACTADMKCPHGLGVRMSGRLYLRGPRRSGQSPCSHGCALSHAQGSPQDSRPQAFCVLNERLQGSLAR